MDNGQVERVQGKNMLLDKNKCKKILMSGVRMEGKRERERVSGRLEVTGKRNSRKKNEQTTRELKFSLWSLIKVK